LPVSDFIVTDETFLIVRNMAPTDAQGHAER
jgi:hypothetical protein